MKTGGLAMVVALCVAACGSSDIALKYGARSYAPDDYEDVYERWTRERQAFEIGRLQDVMAVTATYEAWDFRWAYTVRYAHDYGLSSAETKGLLHTAHHDSLQQHRFFVTLAGTNFRESDLISRHNAWRVMIINDQGRGVESSKIEKISSRPYAPERVYFPSMSPFRHAFRISFPTRLSNGEPILTRASKYVLLRFTGSLGTVDLRWEFQTDAT